MKNKTASTPILQAWFYPPVKIYAFTRKYVTIFRCICVISCVLQVSTEREGKIVDGKCHSLTASYIRERHNYDDTTPICQYYEGFSLDGKESTMPYGVYSIDDLKQYGRDRNWCPYFLSRFVVSNHYFSITLFKKTSCR